MADEIDYKLIGDDLQGVIITLDPGEAVVAEPRAARQATGCRPPSWPRIVVCRKFSSLDPGFGPAR